MDKSLELRRKMFKRDVLADFPDKPRSLPKPPEKSKDKTSTVETPRAGVKDADSGHTHTDATVTQETPKAGVKDTDKVSTNTDATVTQGSRTRNRAEKPVSERSFTDHLHSLNEGFAKEIMTKDRQLRDGRDDYEALRTEYWNYKLSFLCEKAKVNDLTRQLDERDLELSRLKVRLDVLEKENTTLKETRSSSRSGRSSVDDEEEDLLPTAPHKVKGQGKPYTGKSGDGGQLPPITENNRVVLSPSPSYTGKSCDGGQLPPITENNRVVLSPSPSYTGKSRDGAQLPLFTENNRVITSSSSSYTGRLRDGGLLPPITENNKVVLSPSASSTQGRRSSVQNASTSSPGSRRFAPAPPKHPRPSKPSTRSRIPRALPPIRRAS